MRKAAHLLLGLLLATVPGPAQTVEHLYSPGTNLERSELVQLDTATRSVDVAMYAFTDRLLAEALAALAHKGVRVRVYRYRDREQFRQKGQWGGLTTTDILLAAGVEVRVKRDEGSHAPQELPHRWPAVAHWLRQLVAYRDQAPGQRCAVRGVCRGRGAVWPEL